MYGLIYMWNLKTKTKTKTPQKQKVDIENKLVVTNGEREGEGAR